VGVALRATWQVIVALFVGWAFYDWFAAVSHNDFIFVVLSEGIFVHIVGKSTIDSVNFMNRVVACIGEERDWHLKEHMDKILSEQFL